MSENPPPYSAGGVENAGYKGEPSVPPAYQGYASQDYPTGSAGYAPQQYPTGAGYAETTPLAPGPHPAVIYQTGILWGRTPVSTTCLHCNNPIITNTQYVVGTFTWLLAALIFLVGGWLFCFLIPFCVDSFKDVRHYCPNCNNTIHVWHRLG